MIEFSLVRLSKNILPRSGLIKEFHFSLCIIRTMGGHCDPENTALSTYLRKKCCSLVLVQVLSAPLVHEKSLFQLMYAYITDTVRLHTSFLLGIPLITEALCKARGACFTFFRAASTLRIFPFRVRIPFIITAIFSFPMFPERCAHAVTRKLRIN